MDYIYRQEIAKFRLPRCIYQMKINSHKNNCCLLSGSGSYFCGDCSFNVIKMQDILYLNLSSSSINNNRIQTLNLKSCAMCQLIIYQIFDTQK